MSNISVSTSSSSSGGGTTTSSGCLFYCTIGIVYFIMTIVFTCWWICYLIWWKLTRDNDKEIWMSLSLWKAREEEDDFLDNLNHNNVSRTTSARQQEEEDLTRMDDVDCNRHDNAIITTATGAQSCGCSSRTATITSGDMESSLTKNNDARKEKKRSPLRRRGKHQKIRMTNTNKTTSSTTTLEESPTTTTAKMITNSPTSTTSRQEKGAAIASENEKQTTATTTETFANMTPPPPKTPITKPTSFMKETTKSSLPQFKMLDESQNSHKQPITRFKSNTEMLHTDDNPCFVEHKLFDLKDCKHEGVRSRSDITNSIKTDAGSDKKEEDKKQRTMKQQQKESSSLLKRRRCSPPKRNMVQELQTYNKRGKCESPKQTRRTCHKRGRCAETPTSTRKTTSKHYHSTTMKRIKVEKIE